MKRLFLILATLLLAIPANAAISFVNKGAIQGTTTTTDAQAALPSGTQADDILIVYCFVRNTSNTTTVTDFTQIATLNTSTGNHRWFWKRHDGSEGTATCDKDQSADSSAIMFAFRGVVTSGNPWNALGTPEEDSPAASFTVTGITTGAAGSMVLILSGYEDDDLASFAATSTDPAEYTENYTEVTTSTSDSALSIAYAIRTAAGATGTITIDYSGNGTDQFATLVLSLDPEPCPGACWDGAIANVNQCTSNATCAVTLTGSFSSGDLITLGVVTNNATAVSSITDSNTNGCWSTTPDTSGSVFSGYTTRIHHCANIGSSTNLTITVVMSGGTPDFFTVFGARVVGAATSSATDTGCTATGTATSITCNITPAETGEFLWGICSFQGTLSGPTDSFVTITNPATGDISIGRTPTTTDLRTPGCSQTSSTGIAITAYAYKKVAGGAPAAVPYLPMRGVGD